ncbi:MAG TPA: VOC family protein, partial [Arenicellales bacterium]|nr:VOC family protein [Arenicellales bacterium]
RESIQACPRLITWVARASNIRDAATVPPYDDMEIRDMARGDLRWRMTFTGDGSLLCEGALPMLIEWRTEPMPPQRLPDSGCALRKFVVQSPEVGRVRRVLEGLRLESVELSHSVQTGLSATLSTPSRGDVVLSSETAPPVDNGE